MSDGGFDRRGSRQGRSDSADGDKRGIAPGKTPRTARLPPRARPPAQRKEPAQAPAAKIKSPAEWMEDPGMLAALGFVPEGEQAAGGVRGAVDAGFELLANVGAWPGTRSASASTPTLAEQLGVAIVTSPRLDSGSPALVGMQVTFELRLSRPPRDHSVTIAEWELVTPRGRWAAVPRGPATTLPITTPGAHLFRVTIRLSNGHTFTVEHTFEAVTPAGRARDALGQSQAVPYQQLRSQHELQRSLLRPPGPGEQGKGAQHRIITSIPNPVDASGTQPRQLAFAAHADTPAEGMRYHWYVRPLRWIDMPPALGGHPRGKTPEGIDAYDLGTGPGARFPAAHENLYVVICRAEDARGQPLGDARYLQSVVGPDQRQGLEKLEQHIGRMDDFGGRIEGPRVPVTAVHVATRSGARTELRLYLGRSSRGRSSRDPGTLVLIDVTPGLDPERHELVYEGASAAAVLQELADDNKYPEGAVSLRVGPNALGVPPMARHFETDGESMLGRLSSTAGMASLALGLGAMVAAPFTGGGSLVVTALLIGSATAGAAAGALSLADRLEAEELDELGVTLDVLTIAASFLNAGLALKAMRSGPAMLVASRGARYLLWSNFAAEGVSAILVTAEGAEQIIAVVGSERLSADEKMSALVRVVSNLILTGALLAVSYGEMKYVRGRLRGELGDVEGQLSPHDRLTLALLDDDTLRGLRSATAEDAARLARMLRDDPGLVARIAGREDLAPALRAARGDTATDLELAFRHVRLRARGIDSARIERLGAALREAGLEARLVPGLGDDTLARLADPGVLGELEQVARLQGSGRITGLDDWIQFGAAKDAADLGRVAGELREARRLVAENPGAVINVGGDARAPTDPTTGGKLASFDLSLERPLGVVRRSVEVTTIDKPVSSTFDLKSRIRHAADKAAKRLSAGQPIPEPRAATIRMSLMSLKRTKKATQRMDILGNYIVQAPNGRQIREGNLFDDIVDYLPSIPSHRLLDRITLVDARTGTVFAEFQRADTAWNRIR